MVKSELIQKLCDMHPGMLRKDIEKIVEIIFNEIIVALKRGEACEIRGWGRIKTVTRKARIGRNPKSFETIEIPEKKAIKWKMSKILYNRLNNN
tara:strand:+ start:1725 stop:2006 length:282 start_codon:yes stop_codon:yes gene_type:complete